ncbi:MAG: hypothetical protein QHJ73_17450, partial [Armatimonadota bacterium]|nr:hypothetical protein [Armatimonadota bacterium]
MESANLRVLDLRFQSPPQSAAPLSPEEALAVATEAFPRSVPADVHRTDGFQALKMFPAGRCVAVACVRAEGAVDEWDRPVLSARVALIRPAADNGWGRELSAV